MTGGYSGSPLSGLLSGEDDGVVQYASQYACSGNAEARYTNNTSNICGNNSKQESSGFRNLDAAHENHDEEHLNSHSHTRLDVRDGFCPGRTCRPGNRKESSVSTAQYIRALLRPTSGSILLPRQAISLSSLSEPIPSIEDISAADYRREGRFPHFSSPILEGEADPILRNVEVSVGISSEALEPTLSVYPIATSFEAPEPVILHAYLLENGTRVRAQWIEGTIIDETGRIVDALIYNDDGIAADAVAGDSIYTATFLFRLTG